MIAKRLGYTEARQDEIYMIGILHDVGKIGIQITVLNKKGALTDEEYEIIKKHSVMGASILQNIENNPKFALGARHHHERYDGTGYPDALAGEAIPEEARIIAVADAYDAMSSDRSYRDHMTQEEIKSELINGKGTQFDPKFADIMLEIIEEDKDYKFRG
jgi:putative two-component system response regulator